MGMTIGIDIGGTFTDVVALNDAGFVASFTKVPSTPQDPGLAVIAGVEKILKLSGTDVAALDRVVHSSTVSLNAILERKGAKLGILCTKGFRDLLIMGRQKRTDMYDLFLDAETPQFLCPRERIMEIPERLDAAGAVVAALDEDAVMQAARELIEDEGVTALAICYLFSYLNPHHEQRTHKLIHARFPEVKVSLSCEVDPQMREYERLVMTAFDAYLKPVAENYLTNLATNLRTKSAAVTLQIMQSRGGIMGWRQAAARPIATALSGPAAGVIGGMQSGRDAGFADLITVDIGGTSCDIALISDSTPLIAIEGKLDRYPLRQQMIDVSCIGAGGGSIAWIDEGGALRVGPQSAGAFPGPACYGRGGTEPTITDASVVLGYLNPDDFGCGEMTLSPQRAQEALKKVGDRIGLSVAELALGMHRILNAKMADAIRLATVHRGFDPRRFSLMGLGGGGPVHAPALARELGCGYAIVPPLPGVLCANGLLAADIEHEHARTYLCDAESADPQDLDTQYAALVETCAQRMRADGVDPAHTQLTRIVDARYASQSYDLQITAPEGPLSRASITAIVEQFHAEHERIYGHAQRGQRVKFSTLRAILAYKLADPRFGVERLSGGSEQALKQERMVLFDLGTGYVPTKVYDRQKLPAGSRVFGPVILEQPDTTTVVHPGQSLEVLASGHVIIMQSHS